MDGGAWEDAVHGVTKSQTPLSGFTFTFTTYELGEIATSVSQKLWLRYTLIIFTTVQKKVRFFYVAGFSLVQFSHSVVSDSL